MELSNCSLVIVRILNDILLWIYMCCMDGSAYEIKFDFLFCFLLVFCLLLNDRHVKLLRNPLFRFMWSKSNKILLNLYHKINPIAIFFHYEMKMMVTNDGHKCFKLSLLFYLCEQIHYYHDQFLLKDAFSQSTWHAFPSFNMKKRFQQNNKCLYNKSIVRCKVFFTGHSFKVVRGPLEVVAILLNLSIRASNVKVCWFYQRSRLANEQYLYWIVLVLITLIRYFKSTQ